MERFSCSRSRLLAAAVALGIGLLTTGGATTASEVGPSDDLVEQRLDAQASRDRQAVIVGDYADWEAEKSAQAAEALAQRQALAAAAGADEAKANDNYDAAMQRAGADPSGARAAADAHAAAVARHERALLLASRAREQAATETQHVNQLQQAAIATQTEVRADTTAQPEQGTPTQPAQNYAWSTFVANVDSQAAIDSCAGGLTYSPEISDILGKPYYPIHNYCKGLPILDLQIGDLVHIEDVGDFKVVGAQDVNKGDTTSDIASLPGSAILQTCYEKGNKMRVVGIEPV